MNVATFMALEYHQVMFQCLTDSDMVGERSKFVSLYFFFHLYILSTNYEGQEWAVNVFAVNPEISSVVCSGI